MVLLDYLGQLHKKAIVKEYLPGQVFFVRIIFVGRIAQLVRARH